MRPPSPQGRTGWRWWMKRWVANRVALIGLVIIVFGIAAAVLAPAIAPYDARRIAPHDALQPPGGRYLFGTDGFGRDVFSRVLMGSRISLVVAFLSVLIALLLGTTLGLTAGFYGGWWDGLSMRVMDVVFAFPAILLAIALMAVLGASVGNLIIAIGIVYTPQLRGWRGPQPCRSADTSSSTQRERSDWAISESCADTLRPTCWRRLPYKSP